MKDGDHNHQPDTELVAEQDVAAAMVERIEDDPTKPIKRVYDEVIIDHDGDDDDLPEFSRVRSRLNRKRASMLPPIPGDVDDVDIMAEWAETWSGGRFLSYQDNQWGLLIFATDDNFRRLQRCQDIYIDGTFKTCPAPYGQFVTIHGLYHDRAIPFIMCLMEGRTVGHYRQLLQHVKRSVRRVSGHQLQPRRVICDFELALKNAIETELPRSRISGCYFHFCQSLWRKVQELGLSRAYTRRRRVKKCIRKCMALGHLPLPLVRNNFRLLTTARETRRLVRRYPALQEFFQYVERNYINGQFEPRMWNVFERTNDNRTNNYVEGMAKNHEI
jgi:hypothetical protein